MSTNGTAATKGDLVYVPSGVARLNYFYGQLLTQRDLQAEQRYEVMLRRLMQREAFGTGTVAGLRVEDAAPAVAGGVVVRSGLAMDPDGRELLLAGDVSVMLADVAKPAAGSAFITQASPTSDQIATAVSGAWNTSFSPDDVDTLWTRLSQSGMTEVGSGSSSANLVNLANQLNKLTPPQPPPSFTLPSGQLLRDYLFDQLVGTTYLGLRYVERGTEPSPAVLDASCCGDATCFPARIEEGVMIVAQPNPFPATKDPYWAARLSLEKSLLAQANAPPVARAAPAAVAVPADGAAAPTGSVTPSVATLGLVGTAAPLGPAAPGSLVAVAPTGTVAPSVPTLGVVETSPRGPAAPGTLVAVAPTGTVAPSAPTLGVVETSPPGPAAPGTLVAVAPTGTAPPTVAPQSGTVTPASPPPPVGSPPSHDHRAALSDYLTGSWRGLPPAEDPHGAPLQPVVAIARVYWSRFPREVPGSSRILLIDNHTWRPLAPGVPAVRALCETLTQGMAPAATQPH